jgi:hypothetical protein
MKTIATFLRARVARIRRALAQTIRRVAARVDAPEATAS